MERTGNHLLRVEAVGFDAVIADTGDLSTVRGGGLLLLNAIEAVGEHLRKEFYGTVDALATGGSVGLFHLTNCTEAQAQEIRAAAERWLAGDPEVDTRAIEYLVRFARFVCDTVPIDDDDVREARARVIAANRLQALRRVTVAMPKVGARVPGGARPRDIATGVLCALDPTRPIFVRDDDDPQEWVDRDEVELSESVYRRRRYGRDTKRGRLFGLMRQNAGEAQQDPPDFAVDFHGIADPATPNPRLQGKIAVLYADGNGFSKRQDACLQAAASDECESRLQSQIEALKAFDSALKCQRARLYLDVVDRMRQGGRWQGYGWGGHVRLEALLWGGDEFLWVLPASLGMAVANFIVSETAEWKLPPESLPVPSHAIGLVFCHDDAPIQRVRQLAVDLADTAKTVSRKRTLIAYEVMNSFDFPGRDLGEHRHEQAPRGFRPNDLVLTADLAESLPRAAKALRECKFPRRRLHRLAHRLAFDGAGTGFHDDQAAAFAAVAGAAAEIGSLLEKHGPLLWFHLHVLWDYLPKILPAEDAADKAATVTAEA